MIETQSEFLQLGLPLLIKEALTDSRYLFAYLKSELYFFGGENENYLEGIDFIVLSRVDIERVRPKSSS